MYATPVVLFDRLPIPQWMDSLCLMLIIIDQIWVENIYIYCPSLCLNNF